MTVVGTKNNGEFFLLALLDRFYELKFDMNRKLQTRIHFTRVLRVRFLRTPETRIDDLNEGKMDRRELAGHFSRTTSIDDRRREMRSR